MATSLKTKAKTKTKALVKIDQELCKGCEYCIEFCPRDVLGMSRAVNLRGLHFAVPVEGKTCNGCAICARVCPDTAIEVHK